MKHKWFGPWVDGGAGVRNRYLGLKFKIDGVFHYGWARLTFVTTTNKGFSAALTGYAYETTPNKGIVAGEESGSNEVRSNLDNSNSTIIPAKTQAGPSLGSLALGAAGIEIWRREN